MRIKRTDGNFTVRQKADRKIHYAGQGKKHTGSTAKSRLEKQDALLQKNTHSKKPETCPQKACSPDKNTGADCLTATGKQHRQDHEIREPAVSGSIHRKQQMERPSAYRETSLKIKEPVFHRKAEMPFNTRRTEGSSSKAAQSKKASPAKKSENIYKQHTEKKLPSDGYALSFTEKRAGQISCYRKEKYLETIKQEHRVKEAEEAALMGSCQPAVSPGSCPATQENTRAGDSSHIHKREAGDIANRRSGEIPGRKQQESNDSRTDRSGKKRKSGDKNRQKDSSHKISGKSRKDRAAAFRLLSYASDKLSGEEQKDSLLKVTKDLLLGKVKAAATGAFLSAASALIPILLPAFIVAVIITLLFNSPFSILLPKLTEEPGAVEVLAVYTEEFREKVQEELEDTGRCDETELIYEDYEGDGEPDNMADILMSYMVRHGFGDTATVMTEKNKKALKETFDEMTSLRVAYRKEIVEESYEEEDIYGNVTIKTKEVEVKIKEVRITLLTSEDIIAKGSFTEEEVQILRYLMSPEILECIEGLRGGYGRPGPTVLTPEQERQLALGDDTGSQAVKNALARLGMPYSQTYRDSGDYYDCSSLTYYAYKEAGINLSYRGSNTAAAQAALLSDRDCEVAYEDIREGDLIFYSFTANGRYKDISHVAVYAGNGYLIDASSSKGYVVFRPVYSVGSIVMCGRPSDL